MTSGRPRMRSAALVVLASALTGAAWMAGPPTADARGGGGDEVRVAGSCGAGARSELKLKWEDGGLMEVEFEVDQNRTGVLWRVAVTHERRVVWKGKARTAGPSGSFEVNRLIPGLSGANAVSVRAWGPKGLTCRANAVLPQDVSGGGSSDD